MHWSSSNNKIIILSSRSKKNLIDLKKSLLSISALMFVVYQPREKVKNQCQTSCFVKYLSQCLMQSFPIHVSSRLLFFQCEVFFDIVPKENRTKTVTQILFIIIALVGFLQITKTICNQSFS